MSGNVVSLPTALMAKEERVDALARAIAYDGPRPLVDAYAADDTVRILIGGVEIGATPEEALEFASTIATAAGDAISTRRKR